MKNKILTALLSLLISIALWCFVVTTVSPNSDMEFKNLPVITQGEAQLHEVGYMVTGMDVTDVDIRLEGNRKDLERLDKSDIKIFVDVSKNPAAGTHEMTYSISYGQGDFKVLTKQPSTVKVTLEPRLTKTVPVEVLFDGNVAENFMADKESMSMDYTQINVTGPADDVDRIKSAQIRLDVEGRKESLSEECAFTLCDADGNAVVSEHITTDASVVNLSLKILRLKEIRLVANVIEGGGANMNNTTVTCSPETIWVSGSDALLEGLEELVIGTVDLSDISEDKTIPFPIKLPDGISDETGVTEASVSVAFSGLLVKTLTVRNIVQEKVPEGMKVELATKALEIQVRGPAEKVEKLSENDIQVVVDFTDAESGAAKLKATIVFADPEIGAIGSYTVSANITHQG